jgi:hypothetical protein
MELRAPLNGVELWRSFCFGATGGLDGEFFRLIASHPTVRVAVG